jgi:DedD protein
MKLAFWKGGPSRRAAARQAGATAPAARSDAHADADADDNERTAARADLEHLRARARRRLIGAAALLLLVVVLVPMLLDPTPRAVPDNIPIDLPSERTPFAPKAPPPLGAADAPATDGAPIPAAPGSAADAAEVAGPAATGSGAKVDAKADEAKPAGGTAPAHPLRKPDGRGEGAGGRIYVQAAAFSKESAARELVARLGKSGLTPFIERNDSKGSTHFRVRLGPFATREEAERAEARLHALGVASNIIVPGSGT